MGLQPNVVLAIAGFLIAGITGYYIADNWRSLTELESWQATFSTHGVRLPERAGTAPAQPAPTVESHEVAHANVTRMGVSLTWRDPNALLGQPEITLRVVDAQGVIRGTASHRGGTSGIHLEIEVLSRSEVPSGAHAYDARGRDAAEKEFNKRWPSHEESRGTWRFEIENGGSSPSQSVSYTLRVDYTYYKGAFTHLLQPGEVK